ncbi:hypothetical protein R6Q59_036852 [Mikania micrantha]
MQHADSQSPVPAGSDDRKVVCETLVEDHDIPDSTVVELPPDFPPESFWLSKDSEFDWFDRNAFLERKESTKGIFNSANLSPAVNPSHSNSSSQRHSVSVKSKPPIICLPKTQKTIRVDMKCRQGKPVNVRLFPKRSYSVGKAPPVTEPSSPKVSCIGRVRSMRCPSWRKSSEQAIEPVKSTSQPSGTIRPHKSGLIARIMSLFRSETRSQGKKCKSSPENVKKPAKHPRLRRNCVTVKPVGSEPGTPSAPAGLGGAIRFASGRRSDLWGGSESEDVAGCDSSSSEICVRAAGSGVGPATCHQPSV